MPVKPLKKLKRGESRSEVLWSEVHHGQVDRERPWCSIIRTVPGATFGAPRDGIRYMNSYKTFEEAVREVAKHRTFNDPRVARLRAKLEALQTTVYEEWVEAVGAEGVLTPDGTQRR